MDVVVDLLLSERAVALAKRKKAVTPINGSRADVNYLLELAAEHYDELVRLWESIHG